MADSTLAADLKRRVPSAVALGLLALAATWYGGFFVFPFLGGLTAPKNKAAIENRLFFVYVPANPITN